MRKISTRKRAADIDFPGKWACFSVTPAVNFELFSIESCDKVAGGLVAVCLHRLRLVGGRKIFQEEVIQKADRPEPLQTQNSFTETQSWTLFCLYCAFDRTVPAGTPFLRTLIRSSMPGLAGAAQGGNLYEVCLADCYHSPHLGCDCTDLVSFQTVTPLAVIRAGAKLRLI